MMLKTPQTVTMFGSKLFKSTQPSIKHAKTQKSKDKASSVEKRTYLKNRASFDQSTRRKFMETSRFAPIENLDICN